MAILKTDDEELEEARTASREPEKPKSTLLTDEQEAEQELVNRRLANAGVTDKTITRIDMPKLDEDKTRDFKFNWLAAYEGSTGKTLHNTPEDVKTLDNWILGQMGKIENEPLQKVARELKIYNPKDESWDAFLSSQNGQEFKKMLADTRSYKQQKDIEQIWDDKSASGLLDNLYSGYANYMLPVTKEYAKRNYQDINGVKDIAVPFAFDVASQVAMTGKPVAFMKSGLPKFVIENTAAPVISESGQVLLNDKDVATALSDAGTAVFTNVGTPAALQGIGSRVASIGRKSGLTKAGITEQKRINEAATKAAKTEKRLKSGEAYFDDPVADNVTGIIEYDPATVSFYGDKPVMRTVDKKKGSYSAKDIREGKLLSEDEFYKQNTAITKSEMDDYLQNKEFMRGNKPSVTSKIGREIHTAEKEHPFAKVSTSQVENARAAMKKSLSEAGDLSQLTPRQLYVLNKADKETVMNFFGRKISDAMEDYPALANYLTNMAGKPQFGQRASRPILSILPFVDTEYGKKDKDDEKKSKVFTRDYLLGGRK